MLPSQSSKTLRVCDGCYEVLSRTANDSGSVGQKQTITGNLLPQSPPITPSRSTIISSTPCNSNQKLSPQDHPNADLDEVAKETKELEQQEFVDFNNKNLSMIREESEDGTPSTPPSTPVASYPKPLPLPPLPNENDIDIRPAVQKMFSVDIVDDELLKKTLDEMPQAPSVEPEIEIKPRNPQLYQLCQMNSTSSFWWDNSTDSNDEFGLNFRSDGVPAMSTSLSPAHPQLITSESVTSYYFGENGRPLAPLLTVWVFSISWAVLRSRRRIISGNQICMFMRY